MGVEFFDFGARRIADEAMLNTEDDLRDDFQVTVHEHVERVGDDAFGGIFDGNNAVIRAIFADFAENVRNGFLG